MRHLYRILIVAMAAVPASVWAAPVVGAWPAPQEALRRDARSTGPTADELQARDHHRKGRELMRAERYELAIEELQQAVRLDPELVMAHYHLGQSLMAVGDYPAAANAYSACRDAWLRFADALQRGGFEGDAMREDRIRELRDQLGELQRIPATPGTSQYSQLQLEMRRIENLIQALDMSKTRGLQRIELPAELSLALGSAYFRCGRIEDAEREYGAAIAVQPKLGQAHNNLAVVYLMQGKPAEAKEAVKRAEKSGFHVSSELKKDIDAALKQASR